jgi:T4 RnlA family RNA ligase
MLEKLNKYHEDGLVYNQVHPTLDLTIWNYTEKVQYEGLWDEITLMCRGLVTNSKGEIIARPFRKFFNMEEGKHTPTSEFEVYEKMDGSLGIFFYYNNEPVFATRGSFTSDQAIKGREILNKYNWEQGTYEGYTYLFEIIYPENRIVVDYNGLEELVVLGVVETATGKECNCDEMVNEGFVLVKKYDGIKDYSTLKSMISNDAEGYVVRFSNGERMKIKGEEYLRLHKIMTNVSTTAIWEIMSNGGDIDAILKDVPDEFYKKIKSYVSTLKYGYYQYWNQLGKTYDYFRFGKYGDIEVEPTKKQFAEHIKNHHPIAKSIMFAMWDGKDYDKIIWKALKPEYKKL